MKFSSKQHLVAQIEGEHEALLALIRSMPNSRYAEPGVWGDDWTVLDLLAHLTEWEQLFVGWYRDGLEGRRPTMPAPGYKWNETPALNRAIWKKRHREPAATILSAFEASYEEISSLARKLSEKELLTPSHFAWTGKYPLTTYLGPNTCSHYRFARRVLERWLRAKCTPPSATARRRPSQ